MLAGIQEPVAGDIIPGLLACLERAANAVIQRAYEFDDDHYEILSPAAAALAV